MVCPSVIRGVKTARVNKQDFTTCCLRARHWSASSIAGRGPLAILRSTTPATLQARAQAQVQCSQGGFLFSAVALS